MVVLDNEADPEVRSCLVDLVAYIDGSVDIHVKKKEWQDTYNFDYHPYFEINGVSAADQSENFLHVKQSYSRCRCAGSVLALITGHDEASGNPKTFWPCFIFDRSEDWVLLQPFEVTAKSSIWRRLKVDCISLAEASCMNLLLWPPLEEIIFDVHEVEKKIAFYSSAPQFTVLCLEKLTIDSMEFETIKVGSYLEIQHCDAIDPRRFWICQVLENIGGRLKLLYIGVLDDSGSPRYTWEFYSSSKLYAFGSANCSKNRKEYGWYYCVPAGTKQKLSLNVIIDIGSRSPVLFPVCKPNLRHHSMTTNMKLEVLHPLLKTQFWPATITEIINDYYFAVELDIATNSSVSKLYHLDHKQHPSRLHSSKFICHVDSNFIFPVGWCAKRRLRLATNDDFDWTAYIKRKGGKMSCDYHFNRPPFQNKLLSTAFHRGQKLECVYPGILKDKIYLATVVRYVKPLVWILFDDYPDFDLPKIFDESCTDIFPCGWSRTFDYQPFVSPKFAMKTLRLSSQQLNMEVDAAFFTFESKTCSDSTLYPYMPRPFTPKYGCCWSPAVYLNPRCYVGPYLCRNRLSEMPRRIGPGPLALVLKKVLRYLLSSAYRPRDLFAEFQPEFGHVSCCREIVEIKSKYRGKRYRGPVEICTKTEHVEEWCRQICAVIDACPSLIALQDYTHCSLTCPKKCSKIGKLKHSGVIKCLSLLAAKKLDRRLKSRHRRQETRRNVLQKNVVKSPTRIPKVAEKSTNQTEVQSTLRRLRVRANNTMRTCESVLNRVSQVNNIPMKRKIKTVQPQTHRDSPKSIQKLHSNATISSIAASALFTSLKLDGSRSFSRASMMNRRVPTPSIVELSPYFNPRQMISNQNGGYFHDDSLAVPSNLNLNLPPINSNPFTWTADELYSWLDVCEMCRHVAPKLRSELVDGQAFMLLTLPDVQNFLGLKLGPALKLCAVVKQLKATYLANFVDSS